MASSSAREGGHSASFSQLLPHFLSRGSGKSCQQARPGGVWGFRPPTPIFSQVRFCPSRTTGALLILTPWAGNHKRKQGTPTHRGDVGEGKAEPLPWPRPARGD